MASFEIVDSGRFAGGRSNFSQTCNLLSQYLKEKGSFGELTLGLTPTSEIKGVPTETMNLLSVIESSGSRNPHSPAPAAFPGGKNETQNISKVETAPLTIFYAGQVIVFNDFPADKAQEILALASKLSAAQTHPNAAFAPPHAVQSPAESASSVPNFVSAQPALDSDLPIARKNSLARFLEKRRDRITANAPYPAVRKATPPPPKAEAWLGLGP
uniref:Protein TIFY n=1 Tax=Salvia miltiorrhiza TaxID=226208 RepID=A0A5H2F5W0_SALMI|nr:TIFY10A [Salvia miltiorrhiza]